MNKFMSSLSSYLYSDIDTDPVTSGQIISYNTIEYRGKKLKSSYYDKKYSENKISIKNDNMARIDLEFEEDKDNKVQVIFSASISELNIIEIKSICGVILHVTFKTYFDESIYAKFTGVKRYKKICDASISTEIENNKSIVNVDIGNNCVRVNEPLKIS